MCRGGRESTITIVITVSRRLPWIRRVPVITSVILIGGFRLWECHSSLHITRWRSYSNGNRRCRNTAWPTTSVIVTIIGHVLRFLTGRLLLLNFPSFQFMGKASQTVARG